MKHNFRLAVLVLMLAAAVVMRSAHAEDATPAVRSYGIAHPFIVQDLPLGTFRQELEALPAEAHKAAMSKLSSMTFHTQDLGDLHSDANGGIYFACSLSPATKASMKAKAAAIANATAASESKTKKASVPISSPPAYHSRPGSVNVIYLDFNGQVVTGTSWNVSPGLASYDTKPFDVDGDPTTFNDAEQTVILRVWQRVSEDYVPFDVDITTEEPATFTNTTARALITYSKDKNGNNCPSNAGGGVAYVGVFGDADYVSKSSPAWIYCDNLGPNNESYIAECVSHEVGHNMGLSHDGTSVEYYPGHGTGSTSWGTIMGAAYDQNVTQWSKCEYFAGNNTEDDLAIISNKLTYRVDDRGNTDVTATALTVTGGTTISSSNANNRGVIERNTDIDVYSFTTGAGVITLTVDPWRSPAGTKGGNLDILAELYNSSSVLVASSNVIGDTNAAFTNLTVTAGTYYLRVKNTGEGTPLANPPTGYTSYGSIGQYFINGTIIAPASATPVITSSLTASGVVGTAFSYTISASGTPTSFSATGLPTGLTLNSASGVISGTPTAAGSSSVTINAINALGTGTATLTLTINAGGGTAPVITSALTASGDTATAFSYTITASGSTPITFTASPLPAGLKLSGSIISGTPTTAGVTNVILGADNGTLPNSSKTLVITILQSGPTITSFQLTPSPAKVYQTVTAVGAATTDTGTVSYSWDFGDGSTSAVVNTATATHTYTTVGTYTVILTATTAAGSDTQSDILDVSGPTVISGLVASLTFKDSFTVKDVNSRVDGPTEVATSTLSISAKIPLPTDTTIGDSDTVSISAGGYTYSVVLGDAGKIKTGKSPSYTFTLYDVDSNGKDVKLGTVVVSIAKGVVTVTVTLKGSSTYDGGTYDIVADGLFGTVGPVSGQTPITIVLGSVIAEFNSSYSGKGSDKTDKNGIGVGSVTLSGSDKNGTVSH